MASDLDSMKSAPTRPEVWFLTSELEGERASSFRQERWCRIFLEAGATIRIFNLRGAFGFSDARCTSLDDLQAFRAAGRTHHKGPQASVREGLVVRLVRRIKHLLLVDLYLPNVVSLLIHANHLLRDRTASVILMASSPPFSVALIGAILKRLHAGKVVFAVDMRDAWAMHNALGGIKPLKRAIERAVLRRADHVTTVSIGLANEFKAAHGVSAEVMYNVATHYLDAPSPEPVDWATVSPEIDPNRKHLIYTGSTPEGHYDLATIVGAIRRLREETPQLADRLQFVFVGACDEVRREADRQQVAQTDIVFVGHLPHAVARAVQARADVLLFLAHFGENNAGVVSTKLFEYLCLGRPVLPLSLHVGSDVDMLLHRYCERSINVHSVAEMSSVFSRIAQSAAPELPVLEETHRVRELVKDYLDFARRALG